jgi:hypothetical protein
MNKYESQLSEKRWQFLPDSVFAAEIQLAIKMIDLSLMHQKKIDELRLQASTKEKGDVELSR